MIELPEPDAKMLNENVTRLILNQIFYSDNLNFALKNEDLNVEIDM